MSEELNFLPSLTGSFAKPAAENPTVEMVEAAYRHHGLHWRYINTEVGPENLGAAVAGARAMNWAGFNCSLPNKIEVIQYIDGLGESAEVIGAVNCVVRREDELIGENTAGKGFLKSLRAVVAPTGKCVNLDSLSADMVVADVIPNPPRTNLIKDAEVRGCKVLDGLGMLVNQGITGIKYWTGVTVDGGVMRTRLEELFDA